MVIFVLLAGVIVGHLFTREARQQLLPCTVGGDWNFSKASQAMFVLKNTEAINSIYEKIY